MMNISAVFSWGELRLVQGVSSRTYDSILDGSRDLEMERGAGTTLLQRDTISELNELFQIPTIVCRSSLACGFYKLRLALETIVTRPTPFPN